MQFDKLDNKTIVYVSTIIICGLIGLAEPGAGVFIALIAICGYNSTLPDA